MDRFQFQRHAVIDALDYNKPILNIGSENDPARLKAISPLVINCDLLERDGIDILMDVTEPWDFDDDSASLVVLADILEHLTWTEIDHALLEANRVADLLCITVPNDVRIGTEGHWQPHMGLEHENFPPMNYRPHVTVVGAQQLKNTLAYSGWEIDEFYTANYDGIDHYLVRCSR